MVIIKLAPPWLIVHDWGGCLCFSKHVKMCNMLL